MPPSCYLQCWASLSEMWYILTNLCVLKTKPAAAILQLTSEINRVLSWN